MIWANWFTKEIFNISFKDSSLTCTSVGQMLDNSYDRSLLENGIQTKNKTGHLNSEEFHRANGSECQEL